MAENASRAARIDRLARRANKDTDAFADAMAPYLDWLESHWKLVVSLLGAAVALTVGIAGGVSLSGRRGREAAARLGLAYAQAMRPVVGSPEADQSDQPASDYFPTEEAKQKALVEAFAGVAKTDPGTMAATTAELSLGDTDWRLGKYGDALAAYRKYLAEAPADDTLRAFAVQGEAYTLLAQGKGDEAMAAAKSLADNPPGGFGRDLGLLAQARIAEQTGKPDAARAAWQKLSVDDPSSPAGREASKRLAALGVAPEAGRPTPARDRWPTR